MHQKNALKRKILKRAIEELNENEPQADSSGRKWKAELLDHLKRGLDASRDGGEPNPKLAVLDRMLEQFDEGEDEDESEGTKGKMTEVKRALLEWTENDTDMEQ